MQTELVLTMDEALVKRAEEHARRFGKSVSEMVADYFRVLDAKEKQATKDDFPPRVRALIGVLAGSGVDEKDYYAYLEQKYL